MNAESFHFLRPAWLLALLPLAPLLRLAWQRRNASGWERICEPHLLHHLLTGGGVRRTRLPLAAFALGWLGACLALAGPTWERLPRPAFADPSRTVFVLGLSPSMEARDIAPSRMARARHKLQDALDRTRGGSAALVVYREEAFAATPLTDDLQVLRELVPVLETNLTPGGRVLPGRGIEEAARLLEPVGLPDANILLVTDGTDDDPEATRAAASTAARRGARVSVLALAQASTGELEEVARAGGGAFATLTPDDQDLAQVQPAGEFPLGGSLVESGHHADDWRDVGVWLVWIPLLLAPLAFRKGWVTPALAILCFQFPTGVAQAGVLDWFQRPDQRGARAFSEEQYEASAAAFEDPTWRAAALYRAGDFEAAAAQLAGRSDPVSSYNRGNALARAGRLGDALAAYDAALVAQPDDPDARFNRDLIKRLLEEHKPPPREDTSESKQSDGGDAEQNPSPQAADAANAPEEATESGAESAEAKADAGDEESQSERAANTGEEEVPSDHTRATAGEDSSAEPSEGSEGDGPGDVSDAPGAVAGPVDASSSKEAPMPATSATPMSPEEQEAARWMARLPDDPGGLLREKIRRDFLRKALARQQGDRP